MIIAEKAKTEFANIIENAGFEVVDVTFSQNYGTDELTFFIYKKGGITLADCELVSHLLDEPLEASDFAGGKTYNLNISSPGLDRPIITTADFLRNEGEDVEILFHKPQVKKEKTVGKLIAMTEETITLLIKEKEKSFQRDEIKKIQLNIKF